MPLTEDVRVYERRVPLKFMAAKENELRGLEIDRADANRSLADGTLTRWAHTLELSLFFVSVHDAVSILGITTIAEMIQQFHRVDPLVFEGVRPFAAMNFSGTRRS